MVDPARQRVFIGRAPGGYADAAGLADVVSRGLHALGLDGPAAAPLGPEVFAKANWVLAHRAVAPDATTRVEVGRAALDVLLSRWPESRFTFGGNSGANAATRIQARGAGWLALDGGWGGRVRIRPSDEARLVRYVLSRGPRLTDAERGIPSWGRRPEARFWDAIVTDAALSTCDSVVLFPKLKTNVLSGGLTAALKLTGIGLLMDRDRMTGHHFHNDRRIADMQEIVRPDLIVTDAIRVSWGGNQMTQPGRDLGVVIMATNVVAHDAVCARIFGLDPVDGVEHVALAAARGYGPAEADAIEVAGDATVDELRAVTAGWGPTGLMPVDRFPRRFEEETGRPFPWEIRLGPPRDEAGAPGLLLDWLYMSYDHGRTRAAMARWPPVSVCVGEFEGAPAHPTVLLVGDRAWRTFTRSTAAAVRTWLRLPEGLRRFLGAPRRIARFRLPDGRTGTAFEIPGDPPSHKEMILAAAMATWGRARASMLRLDLVWSAYWNLAFTRWAGWRANRGGVRTVEAAEIPRLSAKSQVAPARSMAESR